MSSIHQWAPMRWPGFPATSPTKERATPPPADQKYWLDPQSLDLLHGTPVNCLLVDWSAASRKQFAPGGAAADWLKTARSKNLALFGELPSGEETAKAAALAATAGFQAIFSPQPVEQSSLPVYPSLSLEDARWPRGAPLALLPNLRWPGVRMSEGSGRADAGPTGKPWVDSNGFYLLILQALSPGTHYWLTAEPELTPKAQQPLRAERYQLAIADAAAHSGHWVVSLDPLFANGLAARKPADTERWQKTVEASQFFAARTAWSLYHAPPVLGIISDFREPNLIVKEDSANLCSREQLPYLPIPIDLPPAKLPATLRSLIYLMDEPPDAAWKKRLVDFAAAGHLTIAGAWWKDNPPGEPHPTARFPRYQMRSYGKGRIAIAEEDWSDPFLVAVDAHVMTSYRYDPFRLWNAGSLNVRYLVTPDGNGRLLHLINYAATQPAHEITLSVQDRAREAKLTTLDGKSVPLDILPSPTGVEFRMPPLPVYAALELKV